ncbi:MerR family transcriptional regulator [Aeromonas hydrophila]|uniref:MerR family transcriptional regulator n=1 Tax=Aeromonas hydrophila TaxID=644 RepID=UPI003EC50D88
MTYSISELAHEFDITPRTIRYYEDEGLITPTREGQTRIYSHKDKIRLKLTLRGKRLGFSLAEIRELFDMYDTDRSSKTQLNSMIQLIEAKRHSLHQQLEDIQMVMAELEAAEQRCVNSLNSLKTSAD